MRLLLCRVTERFDQNYIMALAYRTRCVYRAHSPKLFETTCIPKHFSGLLGTDFANIVIRNSKIDYYKSASVELNRPIREEQTNHASSIGLLEFLVCLQEKIRS